MASLDNKKILLGVTGGIAAYKTPELVRLFVKNGASVRVILTPSAQRFVTPETLSVLSGNPVAVEFFKTDLGEWNNHVDMGLWADLFVIAPLTASSMAKMVSGNADNLLIATYLSARCPVMLAPAMDLDMLAHETTSRNLEQLKSDGCEIIEPGTGELASGLIGKGRMAEPTEILDAVIGFLKPRLLFSGKKVLITAGPTHENIDPVRFIGNHSSGKMGFALAKAFAAYGAQVELVSGPVSLQDPEFVKVHRVISANDMMEACQKYGSDADVMVMAAAVADYRPEKAAGEKIKKTGDTLEMTLVKNPDILAAMAREKKPGQWIAGFALETSHEMDHAMEKLKKKHLDMIVLNSLNDAGAGFGHDTNKVTLLFPDERAQELPLMDKSELAVEIVKVIAEKLNIKKD